MENKVQLKEEELVGDSVVLSDIYPKTDTQSVTDVASGETMDVMIDRLWEAINNKLTRVVNSVNNRTGTVVLDASDVGLSNVDNVSFGEIKQWMLDQLEAEFFAHGIKFFNNLNEVESIVIGPQDKAYLNTPFFAYRGNVNEMDESVDNTLSYLGFFTLDGHNRITYENSYKTIRVVGKTNKSLKYDAEEDSPTAGLLKVQIHPEEKVLYLDEGEPGSDQYGLRINESHLGGKIYTFYGAYYLNPDQWEPTGQWEKPPVKYQYQSTYPLNGNHTMASGFLIKKTDSKSQTYDRKIRIYIDNNFIGIYSLLENYDKEVDTTQISEVTPKFNDGDAIVCHFKPYFDTNYDIPDTEVDVKLMFRQPAIGRIHYYDEPVSGANMEIRFQSIEPLATWGLTNSSSSELTIKNAEITSNYMSDVASPINAISDKEHYDDIPLDEYNWIVTPEGITQIYTTETMPNRSGGLIFHTDYSLSLMPLAQYGNIDIKYSNWANPSPFKYQGSRDHTGFLNMPTQLGINLLHGMIIVDGSDKKTYMPMSGLITVSEKLNDPPAEHPNSTMQVPNIWTSFGLDEEVDRERIEAIEGLDYEHMDLSGGLMVNVGECLEIFSDDPLNATTSDFETFFNQGKVNVRLGGGLKNDGHNRITLNIAEDGGMEIDPEDGKIYCSVGSASLNAFKLDDMEGHSFFYNPSAKSSSGEPKHCTYLHLGPGLIIGTEELPEPETAIYIMLNEQPDGWDQTYKSYYIRSGNGYVHVPDETVPEFVQNRYYRKSSMIITISDETLSEKPADWDTDWKNYYEKDESGNIVPITSDTAPEFVSNQYYYRKYEAEIPEENQT